MKDFIIYTTQGTTCGPDISVEVDNCQVLGIIQANTIADAINELFENNKWIKEAGFTKDYVVVKQLLSSSNKKDLNEIIDFLWEDEHKKFQENHYPKNHIFRTLKRLKKLL